MANRKISDLTALTAPVTGDLLPIVDISEAAAADKNKKITYGTFLSSVPLGTAAAPSIAFTGDTNTGIYSPGADQLAVATNGAGRLFVDASGNVGIGATGAGVKLEVFGASNANEIRSSDGTIISQWYQDINGYGLFGTLSNHPQVFRTNSIERLRIDSSGNVGIGTSSQILFVDKELNVNAASGSAGFSLATGGLARVYLTGNSTAGNITTKGSIPLLFGTDEQERLRIDSSGNVGIGTSSPTTLLDVSADTVRVRTARTPASASATGAAGEICWDANYIYVCTATNTWKRTAIATW
jgi:hypothetical protein